MAIKVDGKLILESKQPLKCSCGSGTFVYGDHASVQIVIRADGSVEYGEATYAGEVEYVRCAVCGKELSKYVVKKIVW